MKASRHLFSPKFYPFRYLWKLAGHLWPW